MKILVILEYIPVFSSKRSLLPIFNVVKCEVVSIGTLFHPRGIFKLGRKRKFRKYAKVSIYFVQGCRFFFSINLTKMLYKHKYWQSCENKNDSRFTNFT